MVLGSSLSFIYDVRITVDMFNSMKANDKSQKEANIISKERSAFWLQKLNSICTVAFFKT